MAVFERVMQMNGEGYTESQIINTLRQEGISPKEIYDALTQSKIKSELSERPEAEYNTENMQQSMTQQEPENYSQETNQNQYEGYPAQQEYYPQYQEQQSAKTDIETINEITEQIVEEKTAEIKKQISSFKNSVEETKAEFERINRRLEKLENNFNEMQTAILRKIGGYGEDIKNIANEMHETQDSFSKILNPLTDNIRELQKITKLHSSKKEEIKQEPPTTKPQQEGRSTRKPQPGFEEYIR